MVNHKHHKAFIGVVANVFLLIGLFLGVSLAANLGISELLVINFALTLTSIVLLLITGGLVLEVKEMLQSKKNKK